MQKKRELEEGGKINANLNEPKVKSELSPPKKHKRVKRN